MFPSESMPLSKIFITERSWLHIWLVAWGHPRVGPNCGKTRAKELLNFSGLSMVENGWRSNLGMLPVMESVTVIWRLFLIPGYSVGSSIQMLQSTVSRRSPFWTALAVVLSRPSDHGQRVLFWEGGSAPGNCLMKQHYAIDGDSC